MLLNCSPLITVGAGRAVVVPSPSWPFPFEPQQYAVPVEMRPQVCVLPAVMEISLTFEGSFSGVREHFTVVRQSSVVAVPSWPLSFHPQQYILLAAFWLVSSAQVCEEPTSICAKEFPPETATGVVTR